MNSFQNSRENHIYMLPAEGKSRATILRTCGAGEMGQTPQETEPPGVVEIAGRLLLRLRCVGRDYHSTIASSPYSHWLLAVLSPNGEPTPSYQS